MKFFNPFASKTHKKRGTPVLIFVGEQDGPPERMLKGKLTELFGRRSHVLKAYLAQAHYGAPQSISICLCLELATGTHEVLIEAVRSLAAQYYNRAVRLNIVSLKGEQEAAVAAVCRPFYTATGPI